MTRASRNRITYIVLTGLIVVLSLYLVLRQRDRMQYTIPELRALNVGEIGMIEIEQSEATVQLVRSGDIWQIQPGGFPADPQLIGEMLKTAATLNLTELVSVTGNYSRFGLEEQSRIRVTVYKDEKALRSFELGKSSPTYRHTFVRIDGDERVFQTPGDPGAFFGLSGEDLRDRSVLSFDPETITAIRAQGDGWNVELAKTGATWAAKSGEPWETKTIGELLATLSDLDAFSYAEQGRQEDGSIFSIILTGLKTYTLEVFSRQDNLYPARSSENAYPFNLYYAVTENIISVFADQ
jgi:hypothetical protein